MNTARQITYLPSSNEELKELTSRLRYELNEHYSFAPKAEARLEEVVLGTLGIPNGRQQWKELVNEREGEDSGFFMSLFVGVAEDPFLGDEKETANLELLLDDKTVSRILKISKLAKDFGVDCEISDLKFKDAPSDLIVTTITNEGFIDLVFSKKTSEFWRTTFSQASELSVNQLISMYDFAKSMKAEGQSFDAVLPRYSQYGYLIPSVCHMAEDAKSAALDALDDPDVRVANKYFEWMSVACCDGDGIIMDY